MNKAKIYIFIIILVVLAVVAIKFLPLTNAMTYIDVRTDEEWNAGRIKGAVHFSLDRLESGELPDIAKDENIRVYCKSGNRAETAKAILEQAGFTSVENAGGFEDLKVKGIETE